jgi:hypothetical protein
MAATKKTAAKKAAPKRSAAPAEPAKVEPVVQAGYVVIERDGKSALVDAKSVPELEVQGWKPAK